jgi:restriction endonuclease S subunit
LCFAVTRGELKRRADIDYHRPDFVALRKRISGLPYKAKISYVIVPPLVSGFAAGKQDQVDKDKGGIFQIRPTNILLDGEFALEEGKYVPESALGEADYIQLGEILFNNTNSSNLVGKSGLFQFDGQFVCSNHITRIIPNEKIEREFLVLVLNALQSLGYFHRISTNFVNQAGINTETLAEVEIPLPPLAAQRALVAEMQAARASRQQKLAQADALLAGLDAYLLEQLGITPPQEDTRQVYAVRLGNVKGGRCDAMYHAPHFAKLESALSVCAYPKMSLGEISPDIAGGATPTKGDAELYDTEGVKFLRILNVAPNEIDMADVKYVKEAVHNGELSRSQLEANDVLMTITGRVGTAAVVPQEILPANINQHIARLRIQRADCLPDYLAAYLNSSVGLALSNRRVTGGTRIALDYEAVRKIQIPIPPLRIQNAIVVELNHRRETARQLRAQAAAEWDAAKARFEKKLLGS